LQNLKSIGLVNPVMVGFGIHNKASFDEVCELANGGIIGTAYIKALKDSRDVKATTKSFLSSILNG
jgi:tryptophan synthase alpha chain